MSNVIIVIDVVSVGEWPSVIGETVVIKVVFRADQGQTSSGAE
jgi:hypothetical protein